MQVHISKGFTPFKTQLEDLAILAKYQRFCNFSEMGAGKSWPTAQLSIGAIETGNCDFSIIVIPKITLGDWLDVFKYQTDIDWKQWVSVYHAPGSIRPYMQWKPIIIMTWETYVADYARIREAALKAKLCITFDEAHRLRNHGEWVPRKAHFKGSARTAITYDINTIAKRLYLLTGSPIVNGMKNAYPYINLMTGKSIYYDKASFDRRHLIYSKHDKRTLIGFKNEDTVQDLIASFSVRHLKKEILDLPPVTYQTRYVDWIPAQYKAYMQMYTENCIELENSFLEAKTAGAKIIRMHQICTNPMQLGLDCDSSRFALLDSDLEAIGVPNRKVVIFCHYRHTIDRLRKHYAHLNPAVIYGGTNDAEAQKDKFKFDPTCSLLIGNPLSCGEGTNFTVSSYFIFFEYAWDLLSIDQAVSRGNRPGQTEPLTIIIYALRGAMEHRHILPKIIGKKDFATDILRDPKALIEFLRIEDLDDNLDLAA